MVKLKKPLPPQHLSQIAFLPSSSVPTWQHMKGALGQLPRGWQAELAIRLAMTPSGMSKMLRSGNDPRYDQALACLDYLAEKGVRL
jgi:hypothetical protein